MTRVLRSAIKKNKIKEDSSSNLSISKKSKNIKKITKKKLVTNSKEIQQNNIWNINSILSNIFKYTEKKDLIEFNTVCKRWNNLTNPIIHKTIKLQRRRAFQNKDHGKNLVKSAKTDAEVEMCISNNSKHAKYIKEFNFYENLEPQRAIQLFETFRFITKLSIGGYMSQDQFISMITPLTQLQELNLKRLSITKIIKNRYITEPTVLPLSLKRLTLNGIRLLRNPDLFIQTINSHKNLIEFKFNDYKIETYLEPFFKSYPTLKAFEFCSYQLDFTQHLNKIFESNPQLTCLKLRPSSFNNSLISNINHLLTNLEEFSFKESYVNNRDTYTVISKFSQATSIKKLSLSNDRLSECTINSILLNCPNLEELNLSRDFYHRSHISNVLFKFPNSAKLKKLAIDCRYYSQLSVNSILPMISHLKVLEITLPSNWKECIEVIGSMCTDLEYLTIFPPKTAYGQEMDILNQELHEIEFLSSNSVYKSTLKHLTLNRFDIYKSKAKYFESFPKLRVIEYLCQIKPNGLRSNIETNLDKDLWPSYKFDIKKIDRNRWDGKLVKLNT